MLRSIVRQTMANDGTYCISTVKRIATLKIEKVIANLSPEYWELFGECTLQH